MIWDSFDFFLVNLSHQSTRLQRSLYSILQLHFQHILIQFTPMKMEKIRWWQLQWHILWDPVCVRNYATTRKQFEGAIVKQHCTMHEGVATKSTNIWTQLYVIILRTMILTTAPWKPVNTDALIKREGTVYKAAGIDPLPTLHRPLVLCSYRALRTTIFLLIYSIFNSINIR